MLPAVDDGVVDRGDGYNWSENCFNNVKAKKWGWAKAECGQALAANSSAAGTRMASSHQTRAYILFNEALIAEHAGDVAEARRDCEESLRFRDKTDVEGRRKVNEVLARLK